MKKKCVIVGVGMRGALSYVAPIAKGHLSDACEIAGIYDKVRARAELCSRDYGDIPVFDSFRGMLDAVKPDFVIVTTKDSDHHEYVIEALLAGYDAAVKNGLGAALFKTRIMKNLYSADARACYSFFLGALLSDEMQSLARGEEKRVLIAGKSALRDPMVYLIEKRTDLVSVDCEAEAIENAAVCGAVRIFEYGEESNA